MIAKINDKLIFFIISVSKMKTLLKNHLQGREGRRDEKEQGEKNKEGRKDRRGGTPNAMTRKKKRKKEE